jgi:hypothetical protein
MHELLQVYAYQVSGQSQHVSTMAGRSPQPGAGWRLEAKTQGVDAAGFLTGFS